MTLQDQERKEGRERRRKRGGGRGEERGKGDRGREKGVGEKGGAVGERKERQREGRKRDTMSHAVMFCTQEKLPQHAAGAKISQCSFFCLHLPLLEAVQEGLVLFSQTTGHAHS